MNNETEQPIEATSSEEAGPSLARVAARTESKDILNGLIHDLHNLILILIAAAYYFDCFSILFLLRFLGQNQSTIGGIRVVLTSNAVCFLTHIFHLPPQPGPREFWNHGGALVDFVGEKPASRSKLIIFDILILSLQTLHLALYYKKATFEGTSKSKGTAPAQDLEAEEAGISRTDPSAHIETEEGIEMQNLLPEESQQRRADVQAPPLQETTIVLNRTDFKEVFLNTSRNAESNESAAYLRGFMERLNTIRARRAALQASEANNTAR